MPTSSGSSAAQSDELTLEITRVLPAARSVVFGAFSDPNELARWWGPAGFSTRAWSFKPASESATGSRCSRRSETASI